MESNDLYPKKFEVSYGGVIAFDRFHIEFENGKF